MRLLHNCFLLISLCCMSVKYVLLIHTWIACFLQFCKLDIVLWQHILHVCHACYTQVHVIQVNMLWCTWHLSVELTLWVWYGDFLLMLQWYCKCWLISDCKITCICLTNLLIFVNYNDLKIWYMLYRSIEGNYMLEGFHVFNF